MMCVMVITLIVLIVLIYMIMMMITVILITVIVCVMIMVTVIPSEARPEVERSLGNWVKKKKHTVEKKGTTTTRPVPTALNDETLNLDLPLFSTACALSLVEDVGSFLESECGWNAYGAHEILEIVMSYLVQNSPGYYYRIPHKSENRNGVKVIDQGEYLEVIDVSISQSRVQYLKKNLQYELIDDWSQIEAAERKFLGVPFLQLENSNHELLAFCDDQRTANDYYEWWTGWDGKLVTDDRISVMQKPITFLEMNSSGPWSELLMNVYRFQQLNEFPRKYLYDLEPDLWAWEPYLWNLEEPDDWIWISDYNCWYSKLNDWYSRYDNPKYIYCGCSECYFARMLTYGRYSEPHSGCWYFEDYPGLAKFPAFNLAKIEEMDITDIHFNPTDTECLLVYEVVG
jgi:hypothetical protein